MDNRHLRVSSTFDSKTKEVQASKNKRIMEHDPYNTTAEVVGATEIRLEFHCDTGEGQNLAFGGHVGSPTCGEVVYDLIHDPGQIDPSIQVDHTFDGLMAGQSELLVLVKDGGDIKGRKIVIIQ